VANYSHTLEDGDVLQTDDHDAIVGCARAPA